MQPFATKEEFYNKYWFTPLQMVTLINPLAYDYKFMVDMRNFLIRSGAQETMPGTVANVYLNGITRILAQDEDKLQYLSDYNLMREYYDRLIVDVKSLVQDVDNTPAYLSQVPDTMIGKAQETPPWQQNKVEDAPSAIETSNSDMKDTLKESDLKEVDEVKEFEFSGDKYKMVKNKRGGNMYYKNGKMTSEVDYAKAASML